eukprot:TRINITY_DN21410_c0_g1_i1.p1 TRINITY_DN21410_c0_g1~~TRINITY_DN21410_c0_g1_i1.p1  ORF type:complete len:2184 (-),score=470.63 TRINITY_DN21410_c0_g1_i1:39-6566(-)
MSDFKVAVSFVYQGKCVKGFSDLSISPSGLSFNNPAWNNRIQIVFEEIGAVKFPEVVGSVEIYCLDLKQIYIVFDQKDLDTLNSFLASLIISSVKNKAVPPFSDLKYSLLDDITEEMKRQRSGKQWRIAPQGPDYLVLPTFLEQQDITTLTAYRSGRLPSYLWGCWEPDNPLYGSIVMECYRPFFVSRSGKNFVDLAYKLRNDESFIGGWLKEAYYLETLQILLDQELDRRPGPRKISSRPVIFDIGETIKLLLDGNPYCECRFMHFEVTANEANIFELIKIINTSPCNSIDKGAELLLAIIKPFLNWAEECVQVLQLSCIVLIQYSEAESILFAIFCPLVLIMLDVHYRTIDGLLKLITRYWKKFTKVYDWLHYIIFLFCLYELFLHHPSEFEFTELFIKDLLKNVRISFANMKKMISEKEYINPSWNKNKYVNWRTKQIKSPLMFYKQELLQHNQNIVTEHLNVISQSASSFEIKNAGLFYFPSVLKQEIVSLRFNNCKLYNFEGLSNFKQLTKVTLINNSLQIPMDVLEKLTNLQFLTLQKCDISSIGFSSLPNLKELQLDQNKLSSIESICNFTSLEAISLNENIISRIPNDISRLTRLQSLRFNSNMLASLPLTMFNTLTNLVQMDLSNNRLVILPDAFDKLVLLESIILKANKLVHLPPSLGYCSKLDSVYCTGNMLDTLPSTLTNLMNLKKLDISDNRFSSLPLWINRFDKIVFLNCQKNAMKSIPLVIGLMKNLQDLNLSENLLEELPPTLSKVSQLVSLNVSGNTNLLSPPLQLASRGQTPIMDYLKNVMKTKVPSTKFTMVILGHSRTGKTSLVHSISKIWNVERRVLINEKEKEEISMTRFTYIQKIGRRAQRAPTLGNRQRLYSLDIWDTPEHMYGLHHILLSSRTTIIMTFSTSEDPNIVIEQIEHWFSFCVNSKFSKRRIFLVGNDMEMNTNIEKPAATPAFEAEIISRFNDIADVSVHYVSRYGGVAEFCQALLDYLEEDKMEIIESWNLYDKILLEKVETSPFPVLNLVQLEEIGQLVDLRVVDVPRCLRYLSGLRRILHYHAITNFTILSIPWLFETIKKILVEPITDRQTLKTEYLYDVPDADQFISLLEEMEVLHTFESNNEEKILFPSLLPKSRPTYEIEKFWQPHLYPKSTNRTFELRYITMGYKAKLIAHILYFVNSCYYEGVKGGAAIVYWESGIMIKIKTLIALLEFKKAKDFELSVDVISNGENLIIPVFSDLLRIVMNIIPSKSEILRMVYKQAKDSFRVPIELIESFIMKNATTTMSINNQLLDLCLVVPDLILGCYTGKRYNSQDLSLTGGPFTSGGFADIYCNNNFFGNIVAIKVLKSNNILKCRQELEQEIMVHSKLDSRYVVKLLGICLHPSALIMEWCGFGNLYDYLHDHQISISLHYRLKLMSDVTKALNYFQAQRPKIVHLDLKSPNILLRSLDPYASVCCKVADFGTSQYLHGPLIGQKIDNVIWVAPEILSGLPYDEKVDTYAFGISCWEIITRVDFFGELNFMSDIKEAVLAGNRPPIPKYTAPELTDIISSCWATDPKQRPEMETVVNILSNILTQNIPSGNHLIRSESTDDMTSTMHSFTKTLFTTSLPSSPLLPNLLECSDGLVKRKRKKTSDISLSDLSRISLNDIPLPPIPTIPEEKISQGEVNDRTQWKTAPFQAMDNQLLREDEVLKKRYLKQKSFKKLHDQTEVQLNEFIEQQKSEIKKKLFLIESKLGISKAQEVVGADFGFLQTYFEELCKIRNLVLLFKKLITVSTTNDELSDYVKIMTDFQTIYQSIPGSAHFDQHCDLMCSGKESLLVVESIVVELGCLLVSKLTDILSQFSKILGSNFDDLSVLYLKSSLYSEMESRCDGTTSKLLALSKEIIEYELWRYESEDTENCVQNIYQMISALNQFNTNHLRLRIEQKDFSLEMFSGYLPPILSTLQPILKDTLISLSTKGKKLIKHDPISINYDKLPTHQLVFENVISIECPHYQSFGLFVGNQPLLDLFREIHFFQRNQFSNDEELEKQIYLLAKKISTTSGSGLTTLNPEGIALLEASLKGHILSQSIFSTIYQDIYTYLLIRFYKFLQQDKKIKEEKMFYLQPKFHTLFWNIKSYKKSPSLEKANATLTEMTSIGSFSNIIQELQLKLKTKPLNRKLFDPILSQILSDEKKRRK